MANINPIQLLKENNNSFHIVVGNKKIPFEIRVNINKWEDIYILWRSSYFAASI